MESGGGVAKLTLTQLAKDDEGLYTLRMVTKGGDAVHRAYVFVDGKELWTSPKLVENLMWFFCWPLKVWISIIHLI